MGAHGMLEKGAMFEESARVPWLMRIPEIGREQRVIEQPASHIDLVPTLLDAMGRAEAASGLPGRSLLPFIRGGKPLQDHVFIEWNATSLDDVSIRTVVSPDGWKLCLTINDKSQLFNLNKDPFETKNLFYSGKHHDVIERLTGKIRAWQRSTGDSVKV